VNRHLFVYGTLRRHTLLLEHATFLGDATTEGILYNLGSYPGLVRGTTPVAGELYEIREEKWEYVISHFDEYEGSQYTREPIRVRTAGGDLDAWAYIYTGPINGFSAIAAWPPK
jgi:gamma-glutamylcyclotransferase (GGCT)/AIG2-like uncharacterized protein YtfP